MSFDPGRLGALYPFTPRRMQAAVRGPSGAPAEMSYVDEGPPDGPAMLLLHGNPTWSFYYREVIKAFRARFRCVAPDHVGHGLSDKPQRYPYTLGAHVANVEALVERLALRDVTLVVHDWGGAIGMGWATRHPELVRRIVVLNTSAFRSERIPFSIDLCRVPGLGALMIRGLNAFGRAAVVRAATSRLPRAVVQGYLGPYGSWGERVGHLRAVQDIPMHPGVPSWPVIEEIEGRLGDLRAKPMLICWGGRDFCFDDSFLEGWKRRFPEAEVHRFADAGHYVLEDAGEQVIERVRGFLARTDARTVAGSNGPSGAQTEAKPGGEPRPARPAELASS